MAAFIDQFIGDNFLLISIRIIVALLLSGIIGFEREIHNHSAGFRTHILVGIGSCLMMLLSLYGFETILDRYEDSINVRFDPSRIPSYVVSGIGFLGAGTIIVYGGTIRGLTTAASIWTVAGIGLVVGAGMYSTAVLTTFVILLSLSFLNNFEKVFTKRRTSSMIELVALPELKVSRVVTALESHEIKIQNIEIINVESNLRNIFIRVDHHHRNVDRNKLLESLADIEHINNVSLN